MVSAHPELLQCFRSEQDLPTICWIRPLRGIPVEVPVDNSPLGVVQCDAGCQLERKVDVLLRGSVPGNGEQEGRCQVVIHTPV